MHPYRQDNIHTYIHTHMRAFRHTVRLTYISPSMHTIIQPYIQSIHTLYTHTIRQIHIQAYIHACRHQYCREYMHTLHIYTHITLHRVAYTDHISYSNPGRYTETRNGAKHTYTHTYRPRHTQ